MIAILLLQLLVQIAQQAFVQVDNGAAVATDKMVVRLSFGSLIMRLLAGEMIFTHKPQFSQQFERAINRGKTDIWVALLNSFQNLLDIQVLLCFLNNA